MTRGPHRGTGKPEFSDVTQPAASKSGRRARLDTIRQAAVIGADGSRHDTAVLDLGRSLTIQLPPAAARVFLADSSIADLARFVGWEPASFPPHLVGSGDASRVWIQDSRGDAVLVVRRDDRSANTAFVDLGRLNLAGTTPGMVDDEWVSVTVVLTDSYLPAAHFDHLNQLAIAGRAWTGTVTTTTSA